MTTGPDDLTDDLNRGWQGDQAALERALSEVYRRLKVFAGRQMRHQPNDHTLQPTALVHEAYLRMVNGHMPQLRNRAHFDSLAIHIMKHILIDYARRKGAAKREGVKVMFEEFADYSKQDAEELVRLDDALEELKKM